jgi:hypothetical protein
MCTVLLPPGVNPIAVNEYIISYMSYISYHIIYNIHRMSVAVNTVIRNTVMEINKEEEM